jgi:ABC-2 type transport system permease protein
MEFKTGIAYRFQFMASIVISPLILMSSYFVWMAVFNNSGPSILGYTFQDMITYYVLSMIIGHFVFNMVGNELQEKVLYGDLTQDMLKPFSIFSQFLSKTVADRVFAFFTEVIPVFVISFLIFNLKFISLQATLFFIIGIIFAFMLNFLVNFIMGIFAFWISKIESIQWLLFIFIRFASGEFIPLDFLGSALFGISKFLPFYYIRYGVIQLFLGKLSFSESMAVLGVQLAWILILYILIRLLLNIALKKYGAQGG